MSNELARLKAELENLYLEMPQTFAQQRARDKNAFLISREIEKLENPNGYAENAGHWEGHEIRF